MSEQQCKYAKLEGEEVADVKEALSHGRIITEMCVVDAEDNPKGEVIRTFLREFGIARIGTAREAWNLWRVMDMDKTKHAVGLVLKGVLSAEDTAQYLRLFQHLEALWDATDDGKSPYLPREEHAHMDIVCQCHMYYACMHDPEVDPVKRTRYLKKWSRVLGDTVTEENYRDVLVEWVHYLFL